MASADFWLSVAGGVLMGLAASLLMLVNGRMANIGGIAENVLERDAGSLYWRSVFLLGLLLPAPWLRVFPAAANPLSVSKMAVGGLLVGLGVHLTAACVSGHGIAGNASLSRTSLLATVLVAASGVTTVFIVRHVL